MNLRDGDDGESGGTGWEGFGEGCDPLGIPGKSGAWQCPDPARTASQCQQRLEDEKEIADTLKEPQQEPEADKSRAPAMKPPLERRTVSVASNPKPEEKQPELGKIAQARQEVLRREGESRLQSGASRDVFRVMAGE